MQTERTKKVFIVVGSMGVGKSCFIKELLDHPTKIQMEKEQKKQRKIKEESGETKQKSGINLNASISSDTRNCKIYKIKKDFVHFFVKRFPH